MIDETTNEKIFYFIVETPLFDKLSPSEVMEIIDIVEEVDYEAGEEIFKEGDAGDAWYIVYNGLVQVVKDEQIIAFIKEKECFGEMSILNELPRSATVTASEDTILLRISKDDFDELVEERSLAAYKLIHEIAKQLATRQRTTSAWLSSLMLSAE